MKKVGDTECIFESKDANIGTHLKDNSDPYDLLLFYSKSFCKDHRGRYTLYILKTKFPTQLPGPVKMDIII